MSIPLPLKTLVSVAMDYCTVPVERRVNLAKFRGALQVIARDGDDLTLSKLAELLGTHSDVGSDDWWQP